MSIPTSPASTLLPLSPTDLLTPDQVAHALGLSRRTLASWRRTRRAALPYVKVGSLVRYRRQDVAAFIERGLRGAEDMER